MGKTVEERDDLLQELYSHYAAGRTRTQAWEAMRDRRGRTWVKEHWPSRRGSHVLKRGDANMRKANILRLLTMAKDGYAERDAIKEFAGVQSETWCRAHWPRVKPEAPASLYGHMNLKPRIRYEVDGPKGPGPKRD